MSDALKTLSGEDILFFKGEPKDGDGLEFYTTYVNTANFFSSGKSQVLTCCRLKMQHPIILKCNVITDDGSFGYFTYNSINPSCIVSKSFRNEFDRTGFSMSGTASDFMKWAKEHTDADGVIFVNLVEGDTSIKISRSDQIPAYVCCIWETENIVGKRRLVKKLTDKYLDNGLKHLDLTEFGFNEDFPDGVLNRKALNDGCYVEDRFEIVAHSLAHYQHLIVPHSFDPERHGIQYQTLGGSRQPMKSAVTYTGYAYDIKLPWNHTVQRVELLQDLKEEKISDEVAAVFGLHG